MDYKDVLKYCDKCGKLWFGNLYDEKSICAICKNLLKPVPEQYFREEEREFRFDIDDDMEQKLIEDLVKPSPQL